MAKANEKDEEAAKEVKTISMRIPMDVFERWERYRLQVAPLTPMSIFLSEMTRKGLEGDQNVGKAEQSMEPSRHVAGNGK